MLVQSLRKADSLGLEFRAAIMISTATFVGNANLAPHQSAQVIVQRGTRYVDSFSLLAD